MITFCLFLRAIADIVKQSGEESGKFADYCLVQKKKIVSKLYQIQIKAVNHAL